LDSKGYYAILEVSENASYQDIKRAYRRLARKYHPDRNNSTFAEDMIKKINASFEVLSDREKRREYDAIGLTDIRLREDWTIDNWNDQIHVDLLRDVREHDGSQGYFDSNEYYSYSTKKGQKEKTNIKNGIDDGISSATITDLDTPKGRFHIIVEPSLCMAFGSCETLAPKVFVLEKDKRINPKARIESETGSTLEAILAAAQTCPTKAIKIIDRYTGEQIFP
jgi:curved DNA-binding protein CbpA